MRGRERSEYEARFVSAAAFSGTAVPVVPVAAGFFRRPPAVAGVGVGRVAAVPCSLPDERLMVAKWIADGGQPCGGCGDDVWLGG